MMRHPTRPNPALTACRSPTRAGASKLIALLPGVALFFLSGCAGMGNYVSSTLDPFGTPNAPTGNSVNMQRARGSEVAVKPILPQAGNVWPGKLQPIPTIGEIQKHMNTPLGQLYENQSRNRTGNAAATYSVPPGARARRMPPDHAAGPNAPPTTSAPRARVRTHSSTPPGSAQGPVVSQPEITTPPPTRAEPVAKASGFAVGQTLVGPHGPVGVVTSPSNGRYQTVAPVGGKGGGILIPNGNGTATLIQPNGTVVTVQGQ